MSSPEVKSLALFNEVLEEAEASLFAVTMLTLEEIVSAPLPDAAATVASASEEEDEEDEDELLSSFAQPVRIRLLAKIIIASKFNILFIMASRSNESILNEVINSQILLIIGLPN